MIDDKDPAPVGAKLDGSDFEMEDIYEDDPQEPEPAFIAAAKLASRVVRARLLGYLPPEIDDNGMLNGGVPNAVRCNLEIQAAGEHGYKVFKEYVRTSESDVGGYIWSDRFTDLQRKALEDVYRVQVDINYRVDKKVHQNTELIARLAKEIMLNGDRLPQEAKNCVPIRHLFHMTDARSAANLILNGNKGPMRFFTEPIDTDQRFLDTKGAILHFCWTRDVQRGADLQNMEPGKMHVRENAFDRRFELVEGAPEMMRRWVESEHLLVQAEERVDLGLRLHGVQLLAMQRFGPGQEPVPTESDLREQLYNAEGKAIGQPIYVVR